MRAQIEIELKDGAIGRSKNARCKQRAIAPPPKAVPKASLTSISICAAVSRAL
jgi:hypothetical protein